MSEDVVIRATFNGEELTPVTLKRNTPKLPKVPEGYVIVPIKRNAPMVLDYLDLPDRSYVELRWRPANRQYSARRSICPDCGRVLRTNAAAAAHRRTAHKEVKA